MVLPEAMKDFSLTEIVNDFFKNVYETLQLHLKVLLNFSQNFFKVRIRKKLMMNAELEEQRDNTSKSLVKKRENIQKRIDKLKERVFKSRRGSSWWSIEYRFGFSCVNATKLQRWTY